MRIKINNNDDASWLVQESATFKQRVDLKQGRYIVNAKSILGVMSLNFNLPMEIEIITVDETVRVTFEKRMQRLLA